MRGWSTGALEQVIKRPFSFTYQHSTYFSWFLNVLALNDLCTKKYAVVANNSSLSCSINWCPATNAKMENRSRLTLTVTTQAAQLTTAQFQKQSRGCNTDSINTGNPAYDSTVPKVNQELTLTLSTQAAKLTTIQFRPTWPRTAAIGVVIFEWSILSGVKKCQLFRQLQNNCISQNTCLKGKICRA